MTMTVFSSMNMSMGFVIPLAFSIPFSFPENEVMHPVHVLAKGCLAIEGASRCGV